MRIRLPYPPSVNRYWRSVKGRVLISAEGRAYRAAVEAAVMEAGMFMEMTDRLHVVIQAVMPDRRRRDLDNIQKPLLDALEHAQVFVDDEQIDHLETIRRGVEKPGHVTVIIEPMVTV